VGFVFFEIFFLWTINGRSEKGGEREHQKDSEYDRKGESGKER
jgi:hypothetical protein